MRTVFIIGAGASAEVGLPVGNELTEIIANRLKLEFDLDGQTAGSTEIVSAFRWGHQSGDHRCGDLNTLVEAARTIADAMPLAPSIDNFIHTHSADERIKLCGKLAITESILTAERKSRLFFKHKDQYSSIDFGLIRSTWFGALMRILATAGTIENLKERISEITMVVFNYDRCIEHFLFHAFQRYYKISPEDAANLVISMEIFHPYGCVGDLPWYSGAANISFGEACSGEKLFRLAEEIRTFTEGTDALTSQIEPIRLRLADAAQLVFLGFSFQDLNLSLLYPSTRKRKSGMNLRIFATTYGFSSEDREAIRERIGGILICSPSNIRAGNWKCFDLFQNNQVGLKL